MIQIDIEIKKSNRLKEFFHKAFTTTEDILFSIFQRIPDKFIPSFVMIRIERYTEKRIAALNQQIIRDRWKSMQLDKVVSDIHAQYQDTIKAPSGE